MKLTLQHFSIRSTDALDSWVEKQILALQKSLRIDQANVRLRHEREASPAYQVQVHLVTPGPDVLAEGSDHTLRAAFAKVMTQLRDKITSRADKRLRRAKGRITLSTPGAREARMAA